MTDHFSLFHLPRHPWLDAGVLKEEFQRRSAALHPDAGGDAARFSEWNEAYQTLRDPAARLRHLLELEAPEMLVGNAPTPPALGEYFMRSAAARQAAEAFLAKHRSATTPLARALLAGDAAAQTRQLEAALRELESAQTCTLEELRALDANWRDQLAEVARLHATLSYLSKWLAQLRATRLELTLASPPNLKSEI